MVAGQKDKFGQTSDRSGSKIVRFGDIGHRRGICGIFREELCRSAHLHGGSNGFPPPSIPGSRLSQELVRSAQIPQAGSEGQRNVRPAGAGNTPTALPMPPSPFRPPQSSLPNKRTLRCALTNSSMLSMSRPAPVRPVGVLFPRASPFIAPSVPSAVEPMCPVERQPP